MTIPRKKSRKLSVDGRKFRFIVKERTKDSGEKDVVVTVQEDSKQAGRVMQFARPLFTSIGPAEVAKAVREAVAAGWLPWEKGTSFWHSA